MDGPVANLTEKWDTNASGWTRSGDGVGLWTNGSLGVTYVETTFPITEITRLFAADSASNGRFLGNYIQRKITDIQFDIKRSAFTGVVRLYLIANYHKWSREVAMPVGDGTWGKADIPLAFDNSWSVEPLTMQSSADLFLADLVSVTEVGVYVYRSQTPMQGAFVDNFRAVGPWGQIITNGPSAGLSSSWLAEYGLGAVGANDQPFKDGVSYYDKFVTGMDPNDSNSVFTIDIGRNGAGKPVLRWTPVQSRTYTVMQASDLTGAPSFTAVTAGLQSVGTNNEVEISGNASAATFYKVAVQQEVTQ